MTANPVLKTEPDIVMRAIIKTTIQVEFIRTSVDRTSTTPLQSIHVTRTLSVLQVTGWIRVCNVTIPQDLLRFLLSSRGGTECCISCRHSIIALYHCRLAPVTFPKPSRIFCQGLLMSKSVPTLQCNLKFNEKSFVKDDKYKLKFCRHQVVEQIIYDLQIIKCPPF